ncbi:MAG: 2-amino-4-hydroxy-6-hydroxymethyldihydropteridine diphosphokinase [Isosphaeraceae bacterium]|nr:2-amino-4-hydroxy-6-hydroxymethyldihydropteridine diphosphokinase [Isosphaeraceae bacterium]
MRTLALIGLGSNLGDRRAHLDAAVEALATIPGVEVRAISSYHETEPVGGPPGQGRFLNAAARLWVDPEIGPGPFELLRALQAIEARAGRIRTEHWGARTLDLDLLLYGSARFETPELTLPHPRMAIRRFVLAPAAEVMTTGFRDPQTGLTIPELLANLDRRPSYLALAGLPGPSRQALCQRLATSLQAVGLFRGRNSLNVVDLVAATEESFCDHILRQAFDGLVADLHRDRWTAAAWGDRWVLTDTWLDELFVAASVRYAAREADRCLESFREALRWAHGVALPPTFVVLWEPPAEDLVEHVGVEPLARVTEAWGRYREALKSYIEGPSCRVPTLRISQGNIEAAAIEILAACAATRSG